MAGFTESAFAKKLEELNITQQSIQTLSLWLIHHRKHHRTIVQVWLKELKKVKPERKLVFMFLANDVIQNSKRKGPEFSETFSTVLAEAFRHISAHCSDAKTNRGLRRILDVWGERSIYDASQIDTFRNSIADDFSVPPSASTSPTTTISPPPRKKVKVATPAQETTNGDSEKRPRSLEDRLVQIIGSYSQEQITPPDATDVIRALLALENAPSADAEIRERIAKIPPEVSDVALLDRVQSRGAAEKLLNRVEEAVSLLDAYNDRLSGELDERKRLGCIMVAFRKQQQDAIQELNTRLEEYREKLMQLQTVKNELQSHLQNLPDLSLLPNVTGGIGPLPSAGDLFSH